MENVDGQEVAKIIDDDFGAVNSDSAQLGQKMEFRKVCIPLTIGFFQGKMLVDPSLEEESLCDGMITVVVDGMSLNKDEGILSGVILNLTKSGAGVLSSMEEIAACAQLAFGRAKELEHILLK
jgi:exosome complex RNA-binding protein Rrp42 (RNase PH superfamily)